MIYNEKQTIIFCPNKKAKKYKKKENFKTRLITIIKLLTCILIYKVEIVRRLHDAEFLRGQTEHLDLRVGKTHRHKTRIIADIDTGGASYNINNNNNLHWLP